MIQNLASLVGAMGAAVLGLTSTALTWHSAGTAPTTPSAGRTPTPHTLLASNTTNRAASISYKVRSEKVGIVRINDFSNVGSELETALSETKSCKTLVVDLRQNRNGALAAMLCQNSILANDETADLASFQKGAIFVRMKEKHRLPILNSLSQFGDTGAEYGKYIHYFQNRQVVVLVSAGAV